MRDDDKNKTVWNEPGWVQLQRIAMNGDLHGSALQQIVPRDNRDRREMPVTPPVSALSIKLPVPRVSHGLFVAQSS